jgi:hypothetical protein
MSSGDASDLAYRLARQAEAVCRHYLDAGHRRGNYWQVGDVRNTPGRSMFVRLRDTPKGPAGKWQDAATGEHGDLLDVIRENLGNADFAGVLDEARNFLRMPPPAEVPVLKNRHSKPPPARMVGAARRLFAMSRPISGTLAETYLRHRGLEVLREANSLRFHPHCFYGYDEHGPKEVWPAIIAAVTTWQGKVTGVHRTWLATDGLDKAPIDTPRKAMGDLLGHAVRFGVPGEVMAAGEGIESVLSVRQVLPNMAMCSALSAAHLAAIAFHPGLRRLYIIRDNDPAGDGACDSLVDRAMADGIEAIVLSPQLGDFSEDLQHFGIDALCAAIRGQLATDDVARFMKPGT